jgi:hypothetical protein
VKASSTLKPRPRLVIEADARLRKVENLLDRALEDLLVKDNPAPGAQCTAALSDAVAELRALSGLLVQPSSDSKLMSLPPGNLQLGKLERASLSRQLTALNPRLQSVGRLLAAAAEFYSGWCAAAPAPTYTAAAYETGGWANSRGPALVAFEA